MNKILKACDKVFLSLPLTIIFILLLCLVCLLAVVFPFREIFQSQWFLVYLSYIVFMMLYCSLRRLPVIIVKHYSKERGSSFLKEKSGSASKQKIFDNADSPNRSEGKIRESIHRVLSAKGYQKSVYRDKDEEIILYEKAKYSIFGPHLVHLAISILLVAGIITGWAGNFYDQDIKEGETVHLQGTDTFIKLEKFSVIPLQEKNLADEYASRLRIHEKGSPVRWYTLKVNNPLRVDGYRIYQNKFRYDVEKLAIAVFEPKESAPGRIVQANMETLVVDENLDFGFKVKDFLPDFAIDENGEAYNKTHFFTNPACFLTVTSPAESDNVIFEGWIFRNFVPHDEKNKELKWNYRIQKLKVRNVSGLKFAKNPGEFITYVGLILLVIGSFLSCYKFYRCVMVHVKKSEQGKKMNLQVYALRAKNMFEFERELNVIKEKLNRELEVKT